jgi:hypothetical protein
MAHKGFSNSQNEFHSQLLFYPFCFEFNFNELFFSLFLDNVKFLKKPPSLSQTHTLEISSHKNNNNNSKDQQSEEETEKISLTANRNRFNIKKCMENSSCI